MPQKYDVAGLGNAIMDVIAAVDDLVPRAEVLRGLGAAGHAEAQAARRTTGNSKPARIAMRISVNMALCLLMV